jgi:GA4 desaturase
LDWQSLDTSELKLVHYRIPSDVTKTGEYINEAISLLPPKEPSKQKWFWVPEQQSDEVLFVKFADTGATGDMAKHCVHGSPIIPGTESEEARCSIEVRVLAFW